MAKKALNVYQAAAQCPCIHTIIFDPHQHPHPLPSHPFPPPRRAAPIPGTRATAEANGIHAPQKKFKEEINWRHFGAVQNRKTVAKGGGGGGGGGFPMSKSGADMMRQKRREPEGVSVCESANQTLVEFVSFSEFFKCFRLFLTPRAEFILIIPHFSMF